MVFDPVETIERKYLIESIWKYISGVNRFHDVDLLKSKAQIMLLVMAPGVVYHFLWNIYARQRRTPVQIFSRGKRPEMKYLEHVSL